MFELYIEQEPILEAANNDIGVVTCVIGMINYRIKITGQADHAGTTPMKYRHDAQFASYMLPTTMIFVPSKDGHSHCEPELTSTELCTKGASVLLNAVLKCDNTD